VRIETEDMVGEDWYHYPGEADTLKRLCQELPECPTIVNIGTGFGTSSLIFYEARPDATIFTIDVARCDKAFETWKEAEVQPGRIIPIRGPSGRIGEWWPWQVDMVFVDGAHSESGVAMDYTVWCPLVKAGGLLVFHDYDNPVCPHVKPIVDRMTQGRTPFLHEGYIIAFKQGQP